MARSAHQMFHISIILCASASGIIADDCPNATRLSNMDYILSGYDVVKGNPMHTDKPGVDPGFTTANIFDATFNSNQCSADYRWKIPDGLNLKLNYGCILDFTTNHTFKASEYHKSLEVKVSVESSFFGFTFGASTDYRHAVTQTSQQDQRMISATSECVVYTGGPQTFNLPPFSTNFKGGISQLSSKYDDSSADLWMEFISTFGTHYTKSVDMGSRYGFISYMKQDKWTSLTKQGLDVDVSAKYSGFFSVSVDTMTKTEQDQARQFDQSVSEKKLIVMGVSPENIGKNGSAGGDAWANLIKSASGGEPMPINYKIDPVCNLFDHANASDKKDACYAALKDYCSKAVKPAIPDAHCVPPNDPDCIWDIDCPNNGKCVSGKCIEDPQSCGKADFILHEADYALVDRVGQHSCNAENSPGSTFNNCGPDCSHCDIGMWRPQCTSPSCFNHTASQRQSYYFGDVCSHDGKLQPNEHSFVVVPGQNRDALRPPSGMQWLYNDKDLGGHDLLHHGFYNPQCPPGYVPLGSAGQNSLCSNDDHDQGGSQDHPAGQPVDPLWTGIQCVQEQYTKTVDAPYFWNSPNCGHFGGALYQMDDYDVSNLWPNMKLRPPCQGVGNIPKGSHQSSTSQHMLDSALFCKCPCTEVGKIGIMPRSQAYASARETVAKRAFHERVASVVI